MRSISVRLAAVVALSFPASLYAQRAERNDPFGREWRFEAGAGVNYGLPQGVFRDYVKQGFGADAFFRWNFDRQGILSLRADGGFLGYGRETKRVPLSGTVGGRILVDLTTSNNIVHLGLGPQLTAPDGPFRPYVNGGGGFSYFFTTSSVEGSNDNEPFASTTNYDDFALSWSAGSGILIPVGVRRDVSLDVGVQYRDNGQVRYLRKGSIVDLPNGGIQITPIESDANLLTFRLGISARIR
ncbi:MAG: hypothetical protein MNPFHGCM_00872 [Gemmatimonadaceae bacterium]|nr:hypothetical protein [Gemmatimonadaceae bacterium]